jgi:hypothetical protein
MRRFAFCFSSLGIFAASIVSGCSSDNATTGDAGVDAQTSADGSTMDTSATDSPVGTDARKEAATCVPFDASVATIPTGDPTWTCFQSMCATELGACAADCVCNDAILGALLCSAAPGANQTNCFIAGLAMSPTLGGTVFGCLQMKRAACTPEGGAEGGTEGGSSDSGADGATEGGGGDGGVDGGGDAGTDGAPADAPTAG